MWDFRAFLRIRRRLIINTRSTRVGLLLLFACLWGPGFPDPVRGQSPQIRESDPSEEVWKVQAWIPEGQLSESEGTVTVSGGELYYREVGDGPPIVLIHGGFLDHRMWDDQVPVLAPEHRIIRYDVRYHGRSHAEEAPFSDIDDLQALMDSLGIPSATIVGLSLGGQIALDFSLEHPERVESLVLVAPGLSGFPVDSPEVTSYMAAITEAIGRDDVPEMMEVFTRYFCDRPHRAPEEVDSEVRAKVLQMLAGSQERWGKSRLVQGLDSPAMDRIPSLRIPTLVMVGTIDLPDLQKIAAYLATNIPGAQGVRIPDVAHMVNLEAPDRFNEMLLDFLRSVVRTGVGGSYPPA